MLSVPDHDVFIYDTTKLLTQQLTKGAAISGVKANRLDCDGGGAWTAPGLGFTSTYKYTQNSIYSIQYFC